MSQAAAEFSQIPMSQNLAATLARASDAAGATNSGEVALEHVLLALCDDPEAQAVLSASQVDIARLKGNTIEFLRTLPPIAPGAPLMVSGPLTRILEAAAAAARGGRRRDINGAIVLAAIVGDGRSHAAQILQACGLTFDEAIRALQAALAPQAREEVRRADDVLAQARERVQSRSAPTLRDIMKDTPKTAPPAQPAPQSQPPHPTTEATEESARADDCNVAEDVQQSGSEETATHSVDKSEDESAAATALEETEDSVSMEAEAKASQTDVEKHVPAASESSRTPEPPQHQHQPPQQHSAAPQPAAPPSPRSGNENRGGFPGEQQSPTAGGPPNPQRSGPEMANREPPAPPQSYPQGQRRAAPPPPPGMPFDLQRPAPIAMPPPLPPGGVGGQGAQDGRQNSMPPQQQGTGSRQPYPPQSYPPQSQPRQGPPPQPGLPFPGAAQPQASRTGPPSAPPMGMPPPNLGATVPGGIDRRGGAMPPGTPPQQQRARQQNPQTSGRSAKSGKPGKATMEIGELAENIPRKMRVGVTERIEIRLAKSGVKAIVEGLDGGGQVWTHQVVVAKAMSVRLRAPDGGFFIETASPETQWIESSLGFESDDYASWRFLVTPQERGWASLQIIISARTVGTEGVAAETALPDQVIEVKVKRNLKRAMLRWMGWITAAVVGGVLAKFGEGAFDLIAAVLKKVQ